MLVFVSFQTAPRINKSMRTIIITGNSASIVYECGSIMPFWWAFVTDYDLCFVSLLVENIERIRCKMTGLNVT